MHDELRWTSGNTKEKVQGELDRIQEKIATLAQQLAVEMAQLKIDPAELDRISVEFEVPVFVLGNHVSRRNHHGYRQSGTADVHIESNYVGFVRIEIKPTMGDDYPAVLRQMRASCCNALYLVQYTGEGATLDQVKQIFAASKITILMHADFEAM